MLIDLPDEQVKWLDEKASSEARSRASVVREAVASYRSQAVVPYNDAWEAGFGLWARHGIEIDPHEYERKRRAEWTRPWDEDYEEVRAESPELFDDEDDRQRQIYLDMIAGKYPTPKRPDLR